MIFDFNFNKLNEVVSKPYEINVKPKQTKKKEKGSLHFRVNDYLTQGVKTLSD